MDTYNEHWKNFAETQPPVEVPSLHGAEQYLTPVDRWHKLIGGGFLAALAVATVAQIFVLHLPLRTHFPTPNIAAASLLTWITVGLLIFSLFRVLSGLRSPQGHPRRDASGRGAVYEGFCGALGPLGLRRG